jgi:hypothetical protein
VSADNRTVATDALATLGTIIDETAGRDAIHLAVEPVVAAHNLSPGQHVGLFPDGTAGILKFGGSSVIKILGGFGDTRPDYRSITNP